MESQKQIIENQSKSIEMLSTETADEKKDKMEKEIIKINSYNNELRDIELVKSLQSENSNLKQKLKSLNTKIEIAINREQQYQIKLQEMEDKANDFKGTEEKLNMSLKELSKENNDKEKKLKNFSEKIKDLEKENTFLLSSIQSFDEERQKETRNFLFEQENLRKSCQSLENQLYKYNQVQDQLDSSLGEIRSKTSIISKLEEANDRLAISVRNALSKLELLSRSDVEMNPKQLIKENLQIQRENILLEDQINQLKKKVEFTDSSQQIQGLNKQIRSSQSEINKKNIKIEELEEKLRKLQRESPNSSSSQKKSFRKYDHLQFKYGELEKKYETQMDQVEKTDSLLKDLFETNTNLLKSLQRMEESKDKSDLTIIQLEDKVQNLQNILKNK